MGYTPQIPLPCQAPGGKHSLGDLEGIPVTFSMDVLSCWWLLPLLDWWEDICWRNIVGGHFFGQFEHLFVLNFSILNVGKKSSAFIGEYTSCPYLESSWRVLMELWIKTMCVLGVWLF
jgi:hypothetical protein